ncbi:acyltransferase family protein [Pseudarthrobacter sp. fls2-241-R2A-168]|uniref:acyltransferase family protein n=1 Tax=Pseudarthrobacter sp. fls2-241-R2A-168 TaxID=3040304 RepID=UPI00255695F0|nr:acyltransferase family protein [Pseudarthrobacter sp. fls2-241-R2A-168]
MAQSTLTKNRPSNAGKTASHARRLDIQGLRAVAVLAVVANHLTGYPGGGFVGVDIFFVISGFVITLGLVREHETAGRVSFRDFYFRRVARILPAGILAIVVTVTVSYFAFFTERANGILQDGLWAMFFSANWRFALTGTDYWSEDAPISPLQHYWSLGVEEQFYFVWPLVLVLVLGMAVKVGAPIARRRIILAVVLAALTALSFAWAILETKDNAAWAYFSTPSRTWELGVGALLAVLNPLFRQIGPTFRLVLGWVGIVGITASIAIIAKSFTFPAPWAALPVVSTALVIIAGSGSPVAGFNFLTNKVSAYIGNASYSLYLWHFPVIIIGGALWPAKDVTFYVVMVVLMAFLAALSYEYVEKPTQSRLTAMYKANSWYARRKQTGPQMDSKHQLFGLASLVVATAVVVPLAVQHSAPVEASSVPVTFGTLKPSAPVVETNATRLSAQIDTALTASEWPELSPSLSSVLAEGKPDEDSAGCGSTDLFKPTCVFGTDKAETAVVFGDSTGITLLPTVRAAMGDTHNVRGMTKAGCTMLDLETKDDRPGFMAECAAFKDAAITEINNIKPQVVFLTNTSGLLGALSSGATGAAAQQEWQTGTAGMLEALKPSGAKLVIVTAPPSGKAPADCANRTSTPRDCMYQIPTSFVDTAAAMKTAADAAGAKLIDTRSWFCNGSGYCPSFVGNTPVKRDTVHTTKQYAAALVPVFKDALATS